MEMKRHRRKVPFFFFFFYVDTSEELRKGEKKKRITTQLYHLIHSLPIDISLTFITKRKMLSPQVQEKKKKRDRVGKQGQLGCL